MVLRFALMAALAVAIFTLAVTAPTGPQAGPHTVTPFKLNAVVNSIAAPSPNG